MLAIGQPADALPHLTAAARLTGASDAGVPDVLAAAHAALGHLEQALQLCSRALALWADAGTPPSSNSCIARSRQR
jgi:hypothetical protein